jgi:hypothetical protein
MNEAHIASRMTARHSPLFTLESGQSGLGIYTSQRDAALSDRKLAKQMGQQARNDALARYSLERCLARQLELIDVVASKALGS